MRLIWPLKASQMPTEWGWERAAQGSPPLPAITKEARGLWGPR